MGLGAAVLPLFAQAQENCLKPHQLARMYSESFGDIAGFLRGEGWSNYDWGIGELECGGYAPTCCFNEPFLTQDVMFYAYAVGYDEYTSIEIQDFIKKYLNIKKNVWPQINQVILHKHQVHLVMINGIQVIFG